MRRWCRRAAVGFIAIAGGVGTAVALAVGPPPTSQTLTISGAGAGAGLAPSVAMRADGSFGVAFSEDPIPEAILLRRYGADDTPAASSQPAAPVGTERRYEPDYAVDPTTGAGVVVYQRNSGGVNTIWAHRLDGNGARVGLELAVDVPDGSNPSSPKVVVAPGGAFVVTWRYGSGIIRLRRFSAADASPAGPVDVGVVRPSASTAPGYDVAMNAAGEIVFVWASQFFMQPSKLLARRVSADGGVLPEFVAAEVPPPPPGGFQGQYLDPSVALADGGTAVMAFQQTTGGAPVLRATRVGASAPIGAIVQVAEAPVNDDVDPEIAMDAAGNAVVVWERQSTRSTLWAREFGPDLTPLDGESLVAQNLDVAGPRATVAARAGQRPVVAWETGNGIFARRLVFTPGGTPTTTTTTTTTTTQTTTTTAPLGTTQPQATTPPTTPTPGPALPALAALPAFAKAVTLPGTRRCVSRRSFRIRVKQLPGGTRIVRAEVRVNGKRVKVITGARLTAPVDLRGLPKGRFTVEVRVRTADGRQLKGTRRYRTCAPRRVGSTTGPL